MLNNFDKPVETDLLWAEQHLTMQCLCCSKEYKLHRLDLHLGQTTTSNKYEQACQFNLGHLIEERVCNRGSSRGQLTLCRCKGSVLCLGLRCRVRMYRNPVRASNKKVQNE